MFRHEGQLLRAIFTPAIDDFAFLESSGLLEKLVSSGALVAHTDVDIATLPLDSWPISPMRVIAPTELSWISYSHEWTHGQLQAAALHTLDVMITAIEHGMWLQDAASSNIQFVGSKPVLIDTLSLVRYADGSLWAGYGQFCRHFLAPLALMHAFDSRMAGMLLQFPDGIPLDMASALLPKTSWLNPGMVAHIHMHAKATRSAGDRPTGTATVGSLSKNQLLGLLDSLRGLVVANGPKIDASRSQWGGYDAEDGYSDKARASKEEIISGWLKTLSGRVTVDYGANAGRYSRLASPFSAVVLAVEPDTMAAEQLYARTVEHQQDAAGIQTVRMDVLAPSPGIGLHGTERPGWFERLDADTVMALALIHHLCLAAGIPLQEVVHTLSRGTRHLILEWVPSDDPQAKRLGKARSRTFTDYTQSALEQYLLELGTLRGKRDVDDSMRTLYLLELGPDREH
jgi:hypothetical protein